MTSRRRLIPAQSAVCAATLFALATTASAQDRLKTMPGYEQFTRMQTVLRGDPAVKTGAVAATWSADGKSFEFTRDGKRQRFDIATKKVSAAVEASPVAAGGGRGGRGGGGGPERGRQVTEVLSPDSTLKAAYRDRNLFVSAANGSSSQAVTTDGSEEKRIKYGTASWVYGEELAQTTAFWWSPNNKYLGYYRFDESGVPDYYLQLGQTQLQSTIDTEAYPKSGVTNPAVDLLVYNPATKQSVKMDVRDGKPLDNSVVGHYVYKVGWTPDGSEITFNRTNRRQNIMEFTACNPDSGKCRVIVREEWLPSWTENRPFIQYLKDQKRFIWSSERTGYRNFYLYDMTGKLINPITTLGAEVANVVKVDEATNTMWYMARDGENHLKMQLRRVGLDGKGDKRLTDPAFNHSVSLSPDGKHFVDIAQTHDVAPTSRVIDGMGKVVADLATSDLTKFDSLKLKKVEMFTFLAADGKTTLRGTIAFPSNFDPNRKYPILMPVYGGPASGGNTPTENFTTPSLTTEYGFLVVNLESRAAPGMGKRTLDAIYEKLGQVEMDDMAAGIKSLHSRPYVDKANVGVYGTSYGGYASAMLLMRHPDVFTAASASSPVTDWRHYDTIYTERYMWIPQENAAGYDAGSALKYVNNLKGRLMLYWGTADNNVHPNNMMQLVQALQRAGKSFEVQVGPDLGHTGLNSDRMMEFFIENLKPRTSVLN
ncbi:MAG: DPP IV N-terminal domain-containing protein [Phycisphaerae bacterium]|nr:DPP IV N-terminal domain-containing protein [Gemmatimonadaceae bacterium]